MKTFTATLPLPLFRTRFFNLLAVFPIGLTFSSKTSARGSSMVTCSTAAAEALVSSEVFVSSIVTIPGLGTFAWIVSVPLFLLLTTELTVILLAGAAVELRGIRRSRHSRVRESSPALCRSR